MHPSRILTCMVFCPHNRPLTAQQRRPFVTTESCTCHRSALSPTASLFDGPPPKPCSGRPHRGHLCLTDLVLQRRHLGHSLRRSHVGVGAVRRHEPCRMGPIRVERVVRNGRGLWACGVAPIHSQGSPEPRWRLGLFPVGSSPHGR